MNIGDSVDQLLAEWREKPQRSDRALSLLQSGHASASSVVERLIAEGNSYHTLLDLAAYALPAEDFFGLADLSVRALERDPRNQAAHEFVAVASLQSLPSLHRWLPELFARRPNWTTYYAMWAWRESGVSQFDFLAPIAEGTDGSIWGSGGPRTDTRAAVEALLETREPRCLEFLQERLPPDTFRSHLRQVGLDPVATGIRRLYLDGGFHLRFPSGYFAGYPPRWLQTVSDAGQARCAECSFGGSGTSDCHGCGGALHHILTMESTMKAAGVTGLSRLSLQMCISCFLNADYAVPLFYRHDAGGSPSEIAVRPERGAPQHVEPPLKPARVFLIPIPARWRWQEWGASNGWENLNRIGGHPAWIQSSDYLECPDCHQLMTHLMQLDSDLPSETAGPEVLWGGGGICYVSWCDCCKVSGFQWQCT